MAPAHRLRYRVLGALAVWLSALGVLALTTRAGDSLVRSVPWFIPRAPLLIGLGFAAWTTLVSMRMWRAPAVTHGGPMLRAAWARCGWYGAAVTAATLVGLGASWSYRPPHLLALLILLALATFGGLAGLTLLARQLRHAAAAARWVNERPGAPI